MSSNPPSNGIRLKVTYLYCKNHSQTSDFDYIGFTELCSMAANPVDLSRYATSKEAKAHCPAFLPAAAPAKTAVAAKTHNRYGALVVDLDDGNIELDEVTDMLAQRGIEQYLVYSTLKSGISEANPKEQIINYGHRWRVVVPLAIEVNGEQWVMAQGYLAYLWGGDSCATRSQQISYAPARFKGEYQHRVGKGKLLDLTDQRHPFCNALEAWIRNNAEAKQLQAILKAPAAPRAVKPLSAGQVSPIDQFNDTYTVEEMLETFGFIRKGRKWLHPASTSGVAGAVLLDGRYFSHHSRDTDPLADGHTHDGFDLFTTHKHGGDLNEALKDAGAMLKTTEGLSITQHNQRQHMAEQERAKALNELPTGDEWSKPEPISDTLRAVEAFNLELMPIPFQAWLVDATQRIGCPTDYIAVSVMVGLSAVVGRQAVIYPKRHDDWAVVPNLWGVLIGTPSMNKSTAQSEGLRHLPRLVADALDQNRTQETTQKSDTAIREMRNKRLQDAAKIAMSKDNEEEARRLLAQMQEPEQPPKLRRYTVNDATVEKLGELLVENPLGLLLERDEIYGWLKTLDQETKANDRAFFLEGWNGNKPYTYDRIQRGTLSIPAVCLSVIGSIQPGRLRDYIRQALQGGSGDDGFMQRFQLAVYPDVAEYQPLEQRDHYPETEAKNQAYEVFKRLSELNLSGEPKGYRFSSDAQVLFYQFFDANEREAANDQHPAIQSHLTKYRSLCPSLALLIQLANAPESSEVGLGALQAAIGWVDYLFSHAQRIYSAGINATAANAKSLIAKIQQGKLGKPDPVLKGDVFRFRDIDRAKWTGLTEKGEILASLEMLEDYGWIRSISLKPSGGGRPSTLYLINPAAQKSP